MKYIVKCRYCVRSYVVDSKVTGADFMCEACAGANNIRDVEERIPEQSQEVDLDVANIKRFDMSAHPVDEEYCYDMSKEGFKKKIKAALIGIGIAVVMFLVEIYLQ